MWNSLPGYRACIETEDGVYAWAACWNFPAGPPLFGCETQGSYEKTCFLDHDSSRSNGLSRCYPEWLITAEAVKALRTAAPASLESCVRSCLR